MGYYFDDVKAGLERDIARCNANAEAWEKVTFPTKKDGKPFAVFSKNIDGASYHCDQYHMRSGENILSVYTYAPHVGYTHDDIYCWENVEDLKDDLKKEKVQNHLPKESVLLKAVYKYDLDDVKDAVSKRIDYLRKRSASLEKQLENADRIFGEFKDAYDKAMNVLAESCKEFEDDNLYHCELYYDLEKLFKDHYPYV